MKVNNIKHGLLAVLAAACVGCGVAVSDMTAKEQDVLRHPPKDGPPSDIGNKIAEGAKRQAEYVSSLHVDSHGVPMSKSTDNAPGPGGTSKPDTSKK